MPKGEVQYPENEVGYQGENFHICLNDSNNPH